MCSCRHHWDTNAPCTCQCPTHTGIREEQARRPQQQNPDGSWSPATPLPYVGWKARLEERLRRRGFSRLANVLAAWDERGMR